ncbi:MAG: transcriptional regulator, partial [Muribaculaceae bacterium]|nr:transcriptional regulator [Muribaculaceae bacterium]
MKKLITLLILVSLLSPLARGAFDKPSGFYINMLDSLLTKKEELSRAKNARITSAYNLAGKAVTDQEKYLASYRLFDEYATLNADSALKYINLGIEQADRTGNPEWKISARIAKSQLLTATGLLKEAESVMSSVNRVQVPDLLLPAYYGQMIFLYSHLGNYAGGDNNEYYVKERAYKDSIINVIPEAHPDYLWYKGWDILGSDKTDPSLIPALLKKMEGSNLNSREDAKSFYILAKLFEWQGDRENFKKYMTLSAICDVKTANAEIASLE